MKRDRGKKRIRRLACLGVVLLCVADPSPFWGWAVFAKETNANISWAFWNDGSLSYEDNGTSWYADKVTVQAEPGIDIGVTKLWDETEHDSRKVAVALIDTGVYTSHPDLAGRLWVNTGETAADGIDNDGNGYIDDIGGWNFYDGTPELFSRFSNVEDAHGTHCAALINTNGIGMEGVCGHCPDITVMPLKVLGGATASGSVSNVIKAIRYAEENGAAICNLSVGFKRYDEELYQTMKDSNMLFVVAAGNGGSDTYGAGWDLGDAKRYPACYDLENMIVAANLKCDGTIHYSSCHGTGYVDIAVPGTYIYSASSMTGYGYMTGTSMSAPILSGTAALLYSRHQEWDIFDVKDAVLCTARKLPALSDKVKTGGMLDANAAMEWAGEMEKPKEPPTEDQGDLPEEGDTETGTPGELPEAENAAETDKPAIPSDEGAPKPPGNVEDTVSLADADAKPTKTESAAKTAKTAVSGSPKVKYVSQGKKKFVLKLRGNGKADGIQIQWRQKSGKKVKEYKCYLPVQKSKWMKKSVAKKRLFQKSGKNVYGSVTKIRVRYYKKQKGKYYYGVFQTLER